MITPLAVNLKLKKVRNDIKLVLSVSFPAIAFSLVLSSDLDELRLVVAVPVSVDALSQQSVKLLQRLHLHAVRLSHGAVQKQLKNTRE